MTLDKSLERFYGSLVCHSWVVAMDDCVKNTLLGMKGFPVDIRRKTIDQNARLEETTVIGYKRQTTVVDILWLMAKRKVKRSFLSEYERW